ncbi:MAG TPA: efflux transporter outer membrane subunit [Verrucomicrobiae bacterium]|nr:efflux transporter outer membrane subunit [Verrucomicrobiae bacterium]
MTTIAPPQATRRKQVRITALFIICLFALSLAGCAVGPNYRRPTVNAPATFGGQEGQAQQASFADLPWWDVFKDDALKGLIREALTNNYDLRIAVARMEEARAAAIQQRSTLFPQINYQGEASRGRNSFLGQPTAGTGKTVDSYLAAFNATWEVDLWGRLRRLNEAATAQYLSSEEARRGVVLSLLSNVAQSYFQLLELDEQLAIARRTSESFAGSLRIFQDQLAGGTASKLDTSSAQAALATANAAIPELERQIVLQENQISILLGRNPGPIPRGRTLLEQDMPPEIPVGLPSALLERRPDVREAEMNVRAANAQIGAAIGDFLPRIGLTTLYGGVSTELSDITRPAGNFWSAAANLSGPVFQGGRIYGEYRQAKASWEETKLQYEETALNAFQEVSNALISRQKLVTVREQQQLAVDAYREAVSVSRTRYLAGKASYLDVLQSQQELFPAENSLAQTELNQLLQIVQLYIALGGGWKPLSPPGHP